MTQGQWDDIFFEEMITQNRAVKEVDRLMRLYSEFGAERIRAELRNKPDK